MKSDRKSALLAILLPVIILAVIVAAVCASLGGVRKSAASEDLQQVENSVRRAAVACYASEGFYPPDMDYITEHYGVRIDVNRYTVIYEVFAQNIMPEITVMEHRE